MSRFLLDTDTISLAQFGHTAVVAQLASHAVMDIALPVISFQEQMRGWLNRLPRLATQRQRQDWYDRLVKRMFPIWCRYVMISFAEPAMLQFDHLRSLKLNVGPIDLRIAAIALDHGSTVVTRNLRDFARIPGLSVVDWSV